jgi:hypothetical protein
MDNNKSPHILNASSNFVGFSFLVLSAVQALRVSGVTILDEIAALEILIFSTSSFLSFLSMRANTERKSYLYENAADFIFFSGLLLLLFTAFFILFGSAD